MRVMIEGNAHDMNKENTFMARRNAATPVADEETTTQPEASEEKTFSAKDLAAECGTDPKTFRRWLRAQTTDRANKGGRWIFTEESKAQFIAAYKAKGSAKAVEATLPDSDDD